MDKTFYVLKSRQSRGTLLKVSQYNKLSIQKWEIKPSFDVTNIYYENESVLPCRRMIKKIAPSFA